jgi:hypothetical protein
MTVASLEPLEVNQLERGPLEPARELSEAPTQAATMLRPVGSMSTIAEAIARSRR